tara:strand:- start:1447 stop:2406 length:960 start_codon:yes stop_codon:yes gene_type:complete
MFKNKKVLITGGSGMIGRQLVKLLQKESADIYVADLNEPVDMDNITFKKVDLTDYSSCLSVCKGMDYVFNLVGIKCSPKVIQERPADIMTPMLQFNTNMMGAAMENNVEWYLYTSTVGVYGEAEIFKEENVWKSFPSKHDWFGGWAKRMGELQAEAYAIQNGKANVSIVRPANVYGPYDNFDTDNAMVIPSLIRKAHENKFLSVWGDGSPIRDFIYSEDVARGMLHMVKNKVTEPVNLGSGTGVTIKELATTIASELGREIKWDVDKPMGDKIRLFDTNRAESYGFKPKTKLEDGISNTVRWFLDNLDIVDNRYNVFNK